MTLIRRVATALAKAGGGMGVITAFVAYYVGLADLLAADGVMLPLGKLN